MTSVRNILALLLSLIVAVSAKDAATMIKNAFLKNKKQVINAMQSQKPIIQ